jgi:hypothetical protein
MDKPIDISGTVQTLLAEYDSCESAAVSVAFQNHLYGCLSVMEQQTDENEVLLDLSGVDSSGMNPSGMNPWSTLGIEYGFLSDSRATYRGSDTYKSTMLPLLSSVVPQANLDQLEEALFARMKETDATYFQAALVSAELDPALLAEITVLLNEPLTDSKIKGAKIDPVKKKRGLGYTRSIKVKATTTTIPKGLAKTRRRKGVSL